MGTRENRLIGAQLIRRCGDGNDAVAGASYVLQDKDPVTKELVFRASNHPMLTSSQMILKPGVGICGAVAQTGQPLLVPDVAQESRFFPGVDQVTALRTQSVLALPLMRGAEVIGVLEVLNPSDRPTFTEEDLGRIRETVYRLAERGETSFMIAKFPSDFCADGGRAINNHEPDWPKTLTGRAEQMYERWRTNAKPLGYKLKAEVLNYPKGIIGEIGLFVEW